MGYEIYTRGEVTITPALPNELVEQLEAFTRRDLQGESVSIPFPVDDIGTPLRWCDWEFIQSRDYTTLQPFQPATDGWDRWLAFLVTWIKEYTPDPVTFDGYLAWEGDDHEDKGRVLVEADGTTVVQRQVDEVYEGSPEAEWAQAVEEYFSGQPPAGLGRIVTMWTEEALAIKYTEAVCQDCLDYTCRLVGDEHDLRVYWDLPREERDLLVRRARDAFADSSEVDAAWEVLATVVEAGRCKQGE